MNLLPNFLLDYLFYRATLYSSFITSGMKCSDFRNSSVKGGSVDCRKDQ